MPESLQKPTADRSEHTPGPWKIGGSKRYEIVVDDVAIAHVYPGCAFEEEILECRANARLIAAAPDLFAACESVSAEWYEDHASVDGSCPPLPQWLQMVHAALKKVEGE